MKRKLFFSLLTVGLFALTLSAQVRNDGNTPLRFSLEEARLYASENNYDVINAIKEIEIARKKVRETTAIGLPQVNGSVAYTDFIELPTQLIPAEFLDPNDPSLKGTFFPVKFGTKYNMSASLTASQLIFSGEYIVGLQASRAFVDFSQKQLDKALIELDHAVAQSYYTILVVERSKTIVDSTLVSLKEIERATQALFENGFIEDTDVDQISLLISDLQASVIDLERNLGISYNLLKFTMGVPLEQKVELTDDLDELVDVVNKEVLAQTQFDYRKNIDYQILENQHELAHLNLKRYQSQYLPQLYTFLSYQQNAQRQEWNFLKSGEQWFPTAIWGVQLDIPIFQSGARSSQISQAKIQLDQLSVVDQKLKSGLQLQHNTLQNNFLSAWKVYQNKQEGLRLSEKIYNKTISKVFEGVSSSIELQQNYSQYLSSESDYLMAIINMLNAKLELEKILTENR
jgi:outer membrane protein TolC